MKLKVTILFVILASILMLSVFFVKKDKAETELGDAQRQEELQQQQQAKAHLANTDLSRIKAAISVGLDNYLGYYPLRSKRLQSQMLQQGFPMKIVDDGADYAKRAQMLADGELDFAVFTVDSYILNCAPKFPGQIVMVISESKGADAIVAKKEITTVNDLAHVTATLGSPSHQFIKASIIDFGLDTLKNNIRPSNGSSAALKDLLDGKTDAAVLWEPDVSTALKDPRFKTLMSTENTSKLIVDILVASDRVINQEPEKLAVLMKNYFPTLRYFTKNTDILAKEFQEDSEISQQAAERIIDTIAWQSLQQNASEWFGIRSAQSTLPSFSIIETIDLTNDILLQFGDFSHSPLPQQGPFQLLSSKSLASLYAQQRDGQRVATDQVFFQKLTPREWSALDPVATLKIKPITFRKGTQEFSDQALIDLKVIKNTLTRYPRYRLKIEGHSSTKGDQVLNQELSQLRADAIKKHLLDLYKIPANRIKAVGLGSQRPLKKAPGESFRAWRSKLSRVEFHLLEEIY